MFQKCTTAQVFPIFLMFNISLSFSVEQRCYAWRTSAGRVHLCGPCWQDTRQQTVGCSLLPVDVPSTYKALMDTIQILYVFLHHCVLMLQRLSQCLLSCAFGPQQLFRGTSFASLQEMRQRQRLSHREMGTQQGRRTSYHITDIILIIYLYIYIVFLWFPIRSFAA